MIRRLALLSLFAFGVLSASHVYLLRGVANWLDVTAPQFPTDYVVVLPGGPETRTFAAVVILREQWADKAAILRNPSTNAVDEGRRMPTHVLTQRILRQRGIAEDRIEFLDGESRTTYSDLMLMGAIWDQHPEATVTIVTNRFHTRRARWAADAIYGERSNQISFVGAPSDSFQWDAWWKSQQGLESVIAEYLKLGYYMAAYSSFLPQVTAAAIVIAVAFAAGLWIRRRRQVPAADLPSAD